MTSSLSLHAGTFGIYSIFFSILIDRFWHAGIKTNVMCLQFSVCVQEILTEIPIKRNNVKAKFYNRQIFFFYMIKLPAGLIGRWGVGG